MFCIYYTSNDLGVIRSKKFDVAIPSAKWIRICTFTIRDKNKDCINSYTLMIPVSRTVNITVNISCGKSSALQGFDISKFDAYFVSGPKRNDFNYTFIAFKISQDGNTCEIYTKTTTAIADNAYVSLLNKTLQSVDPYIELNPTYDANTDESTFDKIVKIYNTDNSYSACYSPVAKGTKIYGEWIKLMDIKSTTGGETTFSCSFIFSPVTSCQTIFWLNAACDRNRNFIINRTNVRISNKDAVEDFLDSMGAVFNKNNLKIGFIQQEISSSPIILSVYIKPAFSDYTIYYLINPVLSMLNYITDNIQSTTWYEIDIQGTELIDSDMNKIVEFFPTT